ncbi:MAG: hypothetical protein ACOYYS_17125 [Chloroflexota bacterium]
MSSSLLIQSPRLIVDIAKPGAVYHGSRFDWTAFVMQVTLDGRHTFCAPEDPNPAQGTGGLGLCNEFGIEKAIGYDEAAPGELFPKLGIGLLRRDDERTYNFFRPYEIAERFPMKAEIQADTVCFTVEPVDCRGHAARLTKTVSVRDNQLEIGYRLENMGTKTLATHEYCHNFLCIDDHPLGPDYRLRFPYPVELQDNEAIIRSHLPKEMRKLPEDMLARIIAAHKQQSRAIFDIQNETLRLNAVPDKPFYCRLEGFFPTQKPQWVLTHAPSGVTVCEYDDFAPSRVAVWGTTHVISAEVFLDFHIEPGQSQAWTRRYVFEETPDF